MIARLLTLFMIFGLVVGQGSSMAASVCHHQDAREHALARESRDAKVAAVSIREDAAAAAVAKKASGSADASDHWPAELLPPQHQPVLPPPHERFVPRLPAQARLSSTIIPPLLKPPSA